MDAKLLEFFFLKKNWIFERESHFFIRLLGKRFPFIYKTQSRMKFPQMAHFQPRDQSKFFFKKNHSQKIENITSHSNKRNILINYII